MPRSLIITGSVDRSAILDPLLEHAARGTIDLSVVASVADAIAIMHRFDCVLLWATDRPIGDVHSELARLTSASPGTPVVVISADGDNAQALELFRRGATDQIDESDVWVGSLARSALRAVTRSRGVTGGDQGRVPGGVGPVASVVEAMRFESRVLDSLGAAVVATDADGNIRYWNQAAERIYGWKADDVLGNHVTTGARFDLETHGIAVSTAVCGDTWTGETWAVCRDGSLIPIVVTETRIVDDDGQLLGIAMVSENVSDRVAAEDVNRRLSSIVESSTDAIYGTDLDGFITSWNAGATALYGYTEDEAIGASVWILYPDLFHPEVTTVLEHMRAGEQFRARDTTRRHKDGSLIEISLMASPVFDTHGRPIAAAAIARDITARKRAEEDLIHQSMHDALTGLPNRATAERLLDALVSRVDGGCCALLFVDVDRFKVVNDGMGHGAGDALLIEIADRMKGWARPTDSVARLSGDAFVIVCEQLADIDEAMRRADEVHGLFAEQFTIGNRLLPVAVSIGVAPIEPGMTVDAVLRDADAAMRSAKDLRPNGVVLADEALRGRAASRLELETALHHAVLRGELRLLYQPVVDLTTEQIVGYEALARWQHPDRGVVLPDEFISFAEQTGLIVPIGRWVLREACAQMARWRAHPEIGEQMCDRFIGINVSTVQLYTGDLAADLAETLEVTGLDAGSLHLEITETALMDVDLAGTALERLKLIGVRLDLDDFGTGYSSLSYLQRLPIDTLKIDQSFVAGLGQNSHHGSIVDAVVTLGHALGLQVLAEGVETIGQRDHLRRLGCDLAQGFHWSTPVAADDIVAMHQTYMPSAGG